MKVGDKVWLFNINRRVYPKDNRGFSSPIYSEHFYEAVIEGETSRSWIVCGEKFSKKDPRGIYTDETKELKIWDNENRYIIKNKIDRCSVEILKQIDGLLK